MSKPPCAGDQCRQRMQRQVVVRREQHRQGNKQMLRNVLPTMFGVAAASMALLTALGLPPCPSPMYLHCMPGLLSAEALSCSQAGWSTASARDRHCCAGRKSDARHAGRQVLLHFEARRGAGLADRAGSGWQASPVQPGLPHSWPGRDQHSNLLAWANAYMAATPATWGAAMEVPWPQV